MLQAHDWDVAASGGREDPDVQVSESINQWVMMAERGR